MSNTADLATINEVSLLRLGIALVLEKGIQSRNWLSNILGINLKILILGLSLIVTNHLIGKLQREGFIVQKTSDRRTKFAFDPVVNEMTNRKKRDIFSNNYFDEMFLACASVSPKAAKRKIDLADTVQDDAASFSSVSPVDISFKPPKKRKVSIARKALVVL